ncbi:MAG: YceI family protein [Bacteroidetes bacterium]|nr:MAG: YceI family protein [Bacteroidota bacterium]
MNLGTIKLGALSLFITTLAFFNTKTEKKVVIQEGAVTWKAYKVIGYHEGTVNFKEGYFTFEDDKLTGGNITMDIASLVVTDLPVDKRGRVEDHLKTDDFFSTATYPTSTLQITSVKGDKGKYEVTGDLTIKNITNSMTFNLDIFDNVATTSLKIDRTKFDIKFRSASFFDDLKNKAISDEFDLSVSLKF